MTLFRPSLCLRSGSAPGNRVLLIAVLALALLPAVPGAPCPEQDRPGVGLEPAVERALHTEGWVDLPWFGYYREFAPWIYHMEHGWQHLTIRLTGGFHIYDARTDLWGWSSSTDYPWIYWYAPVRGWAWYARGGTPATRMFFHANTDRWMPEAALARMTGKIPGMVRVEGGSLALSMGTKTVPTFYIGRHEVTWGEWQTVRAWAVANGYDIGGVGAGCADNHPVRALNWYDALKWCNAKSEMESLTPVYTVDGQVYRTGQFVPVQEHWADGFRLPLEEEWEFAARGGIRSQGFTYSGGNSLDWVGWYADNAYGAACNLWNARGTWPVGMKAANELGLHDMSGNVWEWCWDESGSARRVRGGSYSTTAMHSCAVSSRGANNPDDRSGSDGLRVALSSIGAPAGMVTILPGTFTMGSPASEPGRSPDETRHTVTLTRAFDLQRTEVTKAQWDEVRAEGPARGYTDLPVGRNGFDGGAGGAHPVTDVSWLDVIKWLNLKSELEGLIPCYRVDGAVLRTGTAVPECDFSANGYRLPTEAEWEYAARAGTTTAFYNGPITHLGTSPLDPNLDRIGWYGGNSGDNTHPVGLKAPNAWGLFDMVGNVLEWCWDWYDTYPGSATDPTGPASGARRVVRGSDWNSPAYACRIAFRRRYPDIRIVGVGFRAARTR